MTRWGGGRAMAARKHFTPLVAAGVDCPRCGLPITPDTPWDVGHQVDQALGGTHDLANLWPEHRRCNQAAGGRLAQQLARTKGPNPPRTVRRRTWT